MSFGGGGFGSGGGGFGSGSGTGNTFGGFGSNNNNNNSGFGSNANTSSPFGQSNTNTGGGLFGSTNNTSSPFGGGSGGGFGSNNNNTTFGSKPFGAGATGTSGLFGGGATSGSTFGGFGATANTNTSSGFGSGGGNTGGLFGQNKTGFGAGGTSTGSTSLFGGGSGGNTTGGFGANTGGGFGSSPAPAFGGGNQQQNYPNNGTANTPFNAYVEKDGTSGNATQHYQTITLQDPYKNWSLEELRIVDYNQGRRYGNQNGQAGAFGQSSGFGGFGNTSNTTTSFGSNANSGGGGLFGNNANNTTSTPFGQSNTTTTFGSGTNTTGGGLFGQNKPAGGLFGSTSTPQPATGGGLFGGSNTNAGGFGSGGGNAFGSSTSGGGGLFGQQNQTQNKPAFGGFGASTTTGSTPFGGSSTGGFGTNNNTSGGGLFGQQNQASAAPAFGSTNTTSNNTGGLFGGGGSSFGQNQTQNQNQPAGNLFGGFGQNNQQNQQKPAGGLFGSSTTNTTTGGGLFGGNNNQPQQTGGLFGGNNNQPQQTGGLFGGGATQNAGNSLFGNKPAATGGLFGNAPQNTGSTGGGLFGGLNTQNNQQNQGSSLFGQQNQQKPGGGLFGNSTTNTNTGGGLFGSLGQNNNQPQQSGGLGGSLFGNQSQQQQQQPQGSSLFGASGGSLLQTSINTNPYGNDSLFAGLTTPSQSPGPLATPLSSSQKPRKNAILPQHKLNPSASTRLTTPQNKRLGGYGFSYSTYGSPASASSSSSPGFSSFLGGSGSLTRSLGKSLSTSNLRNSYNPEASILAPGAFSTNGRSYASGSLKKLNINRNINARTPLFDEPPEKKRVSFANGSTNGGAATGQEVALRDQPEVASPSEGASSQSSSTVNGDAVNGTPSRPEMSQVNGNGLTPVPENGALAPRTSASLNKQLQVQDQTPGQYYSEPPMAQLRKMDRNSLSAVPNFKVGRQGMGEILFNMGKPVDLTGVDLDKVFGDIVDFNTTRIVKVYPETYNKPALGSGLNLPSRVTLANSWPRNKYGRKDTKHLERLKRIDDCSFVAYRPETGEWVFDVPHFSSYGLDYDGEQYSDEDDEESDLSDAPDSPAQLRSSQMSSTPQKDQDDSLVDETQSSPDDTFDFKKDKRKRASVPGGYGDEVPYEEDDSMDMTGESFLGERSVGSLDGQKEDYSEDSESEQDEDQDMADSVSGPVQTTEQPAAKGSIMPKSILKNSQVLRPTLGTPSKGPLVFDDDWANQLQRTISPKKQDRRALRESQGDVLRERDTNATKLGQSANGQETFTRMEMMESMFGEADKGKGLMKRSGHGIELPYAKRPKTANDLDDLSASDRDFHSCNKPHFTETGILVYTTKGSRTLEGNSFPTIQQPLVGENKDIRFTKLPTFADAVPKTLQFQKKHTEFHPKDGVPRAKIMVAPSPVEFSQLAETVAVDSSAGVHEQRVWKLLSILFDEMDEVPNDMTQELFDQHKERFRKDKLSDFWQSLVYEDAAKHAQDAPSTEEKAIAYLSGHNVEDACHALLNGLNLRLATMVAQIGGDETMRSDMTAQIDEWRRMDVLSEMEESVRALYELVAGNCAKSEGKGQPGRENAAATFNIAARFKLDWRRAFGLRLWYGCMIDEPIEMAVAQFADALRDGTEDVKPVPWFTEQDIELGWRDPTPNAREDLLWGILKLYASSKLEIPANIEDILAPENVSGHPLNARLSFQLYTLFKSRQDDAEEFEERRVGMPTVRDSTGLRQSLMSNTSASEKEQAEDPLVELGDKLTLTYAASLHTPEHWTSAVFVYAHLSSPALSEHYIRSLIFQYIHTFRVDEADATFKFLSEEVRVPVEWIHAAAAVKAKAEGDDVRQTVHLIKARELEEAHQVLCRGVGPECIISRQHDALREILGEFLPTPNNSPVADGASHSTRAGHRRHELVHGWKRGGEIYYDYIELDDLKKQVSWRANPELDNKISTLLSKLQKALEGVARDGWEGRGLEERVALTEIAGVVAGELAKNNHMDRSHVLKLPLTEDQWLRHSMDLSVNYYKAVMASGK